MLDVRDYHHLRRHLAEVTFQLGDALRSAGSQRDLSWHVLSLLLDTACQAKADGSSGGPAPLSPEARPGALTSDARVEIDSVLECEASWLTDHPELWSDYGSELLRTTAGRWDSQLLTSHALQRVVEAVLAGTLASRARERVGVLDITCGGATLLATAARALQNDEVFLAGQDINPSMLSVARQNLYLAGYEAELKCEDVLAEDAFGGQTFDLVLADAPLGLRWTSQPGRGVDDRFRFGLSSDASLLFLQALLTKVKSAEMGGGLAIMFVGEGSLFAGGSGGHTIRKAITDLDLLQAVIALPNGLNVAAGVRLSALVLNTAKSKAWRGKTQLIDLRGKFEESAFGPEQRQLNELALQEVTRALKLPKSSAQTRIVSGKQLYFHQAILSLARPRIGFSTTARKLPSFSIMVPASQDISTWSTSRYGRLGRAPEITIETATQVRWDIGATLETEAERNLRLALKNIGWPSGRLLGLVEHAEYLRSEKAADRAEKLTSLLDDERLMLPIEPHFDAAYGPVPETVSAHRCLLLSLGSGIEGRFLAAWLNSPDGRRARAEAVPAMKISPRSLSSTDLLRLLDGLVVPVPETEIQAGFADAIGSLDAAQQRVEYLRAEFWRAPSEGADIQRIIRKWLEAGDLSDWAESLPNPLSSSLRAFEAFKGDDEKAARQLVRFWEAFMAFTATYMMSALRQDTSLWQPEIPRIREALKHGNCDFNRATIGMWRIIIERLARFFRTGLASDDSDTVKRYAQLLGNPPADLRDHLMNPALVGILSDVNSLRNDFEGHGGTMNRLQAKAAREAFEEKTNQLRDLIGSGWSEFRLVRPGSMKYRDSRYQVEVEVLTGTQFPFGSDRISTDRPLEDGDLYLVSDTANVPLVPLVRIPSSCYFYNRREKDRVRFVAYSIADENEIYIDDEYVMQFLNELNHVTPAAELPGLASLD